MAQQLATLYPLRKITVDGTASITLASLESLEIHGEIPEDRQPDVFAAVGYLVMLVQNLASILDVQLPFPCKFGSDVASVIPRNRQQGFTRMSPNPTMSTRSAPATFQSAVRSIYYHRLPRCTHPYNKKEHQFSVYDGICTREYFLALAMLRENLALLCSRAGRLTQRNTPVLQLLLFCLNSPHFGCFTPPPLRVIKSAQAEGPRRGPSGEDGDWTVLEDD